MARRKSAKSRSKKTVRRKATRRKPAAKKAARRKPAAKTTARRKSAKRKAAPRRAARAAAPAPKPWDRRGVITHTELASADPAATQAWCQRVFGWTFMPPMPMPDGEYRMFRFASDTGGGIRATSPPEPPGSIPYCEVESIHAAYESALAAGATGMMAPQAVPGNMGWIALVSAPGGVAIGLWAEK